VDKKEKQKKLVSSKVFLTKVMVLVEKVRIATQTRLSHLKIQGTVDPETEELFIELKRLEKYVDGKAEGWVLSHPASYWFLLIKGVGLENIAKVIAPIDITKAHYPSSLHKFFGYHVVNGFAPKRQKGEKTDWNFEQRVFANRLATSLIRGKGKFYQYYLQEKKKYEERFTSQGFKIVDAAKLPRKKVSKTKASSTSPKGKGWLCKTDDCISKGHVNQMAIRKMIKLFLSCLWLVWREAEGLPLSEPYPIGQLGHQHKIDPWEMVDKEKPSCKKAVIGKKTSAKKRAKEIK